MNTETGYCYVVLFSNGFVKGGKSRDVFKRYKTHKATAAALGISVKGAFYTEPHEDYHANEKRLLSTLSMVSESRVGEFFRGVAEKSAVEALNSLGFGMNVIENGWFMAFQDSFEELAKDRELWGQPMAILCYLFSKLDFENDIAIQQADIAKALEIDKHQTSKAMKKLVDKGVIMKGPKIGRASAYKLNINYGWKGKVVNFKKEQKKKAFDVINGGAKNQEPA